MPREPSCLLRRYGDPPMTMRCAASSLTKRRRIASGWEGGSRLRLSGRRRLGVRMEEITRGETNGTQTGATRWTEDLTGPRLWVASQSVSVPTASWIWREASGSGVLTGTPTAILKARHGTLRGRRRVTHA